MPVIACPDCGREVSTGAVACPHCGRPNSAAMAAPAMPQGVAQPAGPEETLWQGSPSSRVLAWRAIGIVVTAVAIYVLAHWIAGRTADLDQSTRILRMGWWVMAVVAALQIVGLIVALIRIRSTSYTITTQRVLIERGMLSRSVSEIDLRTIDDTQLFQSAGQRILGIGNITLVASDKEAPIVVLQNIPDARNMRETIRSNVYRVSQRQFYMRQA